MLGTINEDGSVHLVPITFALEVNVLYSAIDDKPKSTRSLKRLENIRRDPRVTVLVEHYEDDWSRLWWCRLEGTARIVEERSQVTRGRELLAAKYASYRSKQPPGPWIVISIEAQAGWTAAA